MNKKLQLGLLGAFSLFLVAFTINADSGLVEIYKSITKNYKNLENSADKSYASMHSWLDDEGMRSKYAILKSVASLELLEQAAGVPVFKSGPHTEGGMNYDSKTEFGHYNPKFVLNSLKSLTKLLKNKKFVKKAQPLYNAKFKKMARVYLVAYKFIHSIKSFKGVESVNVEYIASQYSESLNTGSPIDLQEKFREFSTQMESNHGLSWYESNVAAGFWVRRSIDGTDVHFI